jgi:Transcription factor WhiB
VTAASPFGIPAEAMPAWLSLSAALEDLGRPPVCAADPEAWAADAKPRVRAEAMEACGHCPVLKACAAYADAAGEKHGVWGGVDRSTRPAKRRAVA